MLADIMTSRNYKNWYGWCIKKAPWIPIQHLEQMQRLFASISKLANTPAVIRKAMAGRPLDPAPFVQLYNAASDLVRDIKVCTQLGSLGQIFAEPSSLCVALTPAPRTPPAKCPKVGQTKNNNSENQRKKKQAQKEGWLKKLARGKFRSPPSIQTNICAQHIVVDCACHHMMAMGSCNYSCTSWAS
eukprot:12732285-Ditylum_brightwellii.AAC.1